MSDATEADLREELGKAYAEISDLIDERGDNRVEERDAIASWLRRIAPNHEGDCMVSPATVIRSLADDIEHERYRNDR